MKFYETPVIGLELFTNDDVLTASVPTLVDGVFGVDDEISDSFGKYFPEG